MANQYVNKVVTSGGTTLIDLTGDTVTDASHIMQGYVGHLADGSQVTGTGQGGGTAAISVVDTTDSHGGTVRTITALDISDTTAVAADVAQGKYFYTAQGVKTAGTASGGGGGPSATQHTIHLEFSDSTDTDITVYYDDPLLGTMITAYIPETYSGKTVDVAELDGVAWYTRPTETWETYVDGMVTYLYEGDGDYPYCWISDLGSTPIVVGDVYRVTYQNVEYRLTAKTYNGTKIIGNPKYMMGTDDGSGVPVLFQDYTHYGAWTGELDIPNVQTSVRIKIEHLVTS